MSAYVAAIDCGTTLVKSAIIGLRGEVRGVAGRRSPCLRFLDGRIENDPRTITGACLSSLRDAVRLSGVRPADVQALAVANQRATVLCVEGEGKPLGNAISWQDMRGAREIESLRRRLSDRRYYAITGLPNNPVFTLGKILWIQANDPRRFRRTSRFVLVHDYVLRELGAPDFFCDCSNASLTGLFDVGTLQWSRPLLDLCGIPASRMPQLVPSGRQVGCLSRSAARRTGLPEGLPLVSGGGDQQCAGVGAGAVSPGVLEVTLGTVAAPLCYASRPSLDPKRRVMACAHAVPGRWEAEGLQTSAGACLDWLARLIQGGRLFRRTAFEEAARVPPGARGVIFYPYLAGASAPHWIPNARGAFLGLTLTHGHPELLRAVLEGVSLQTREIFEVFASLRVPVREVRLTGGCTAIEVWNQMQADIYGLPVSTLANPQATLAGAAVLAAVGVGAFASVAEGARRMVKVRRTYSPNPGRAARYEEVYRAFRATYVAMVKGKVFGIEPGKG